MNYTPYERNVLREIDAWEKKGTDRTGAVADILVSPIRALVGKMPERVKETVTRAVAGYMEILKDLSYWTYSDKTILNRAKRQNLMVERISDLADCDIEKLDVIARGCFASNRLLATLQGAGCGLGGIGLIAADIPALFAIGFRTIQQIGSSYGFDMRNPAMTPIVLGIYHAGTGLSVTAKASLMADIHLAAAGGAAGVLDGALMIELLRKATGALPLKIAENLSKKKLGQAVPIVGAVIGAGFNYWFLGETAMSAYMIFRRLHLERKNEMMEPTHQGKSVLRSLKRMVDSYLPASA